MAVDMAISATENPLGKVFTSDYQLTIPSFQRAYTWQAENIEQLVNDLQDACADPDTPYFLGSLILVKDGPTQYQVIDGQQRLISLSIIVSVLRELEDDPDLIDSLNDLILEPGDKLRGIKAEPRLTLRERDTDFFRMYVQEGDLEGLFDLRDNDIASHAQRNIAVNTRRTFDLLAAMDAKDRRRFASYLVNGVTLVIVTTDDLAGAHRIFDVMNMRGVPLTASDVFKAKTIAEISPAARNAYATRWDDIMDPLGDDSHTLEEFFSDLHLIVSHKAVCTQLLEEFRKDVLKPYVKKQNVISFIDDLLAPYANAWLILNRPTDANLPDDIVAMLVSLADYQTTDWKPVAMWALVNSIRNLGSANAQVFSTPGNIGNERARRTPPITRHRQTPRRSRRTRTRHRRRQPQPAKPTRPTHTRRKRHPRPQQRPYPPTDPWIPHHRRGPTFRTRASTWRVADQSRHEETSAHPRQRAEGRLPHHPTAQSQSVADHARTGQREIRFRRLAGVGA